MGSVGIREIWLTLLSAAQEPLQGFCRRRKRNEPLVRVAVHLRLSRMTEGGVSILEKAKSFLPRSLTEAPMW